MADISKVRLPGGGSDDYDIYDQYSVQLGISRATQLTSSSDLNTISTPGNYTLASNAIATSASNTPANYAGRLLVLRPLNGNTYVSQFYIPYNSTANGIYVRNSSDSGSTWTAWAQAVTNRITATTARNGVMTSAQATTLDEIPDTYVAKAGDTMTGDLAITKSIPTLTLRDSAIDYTTSPSSTHYNYIRFLDKNSNYTGFIQNAIYSTGRINISIAARTGSTSTTSIYTNYLTLNVEKDGTQSVSISAPAAWRTALAAVNKDGDTMTGSLSINSSGATTAAFMGVKVQNTFNSAICSMEVDNNGKHGIWSSGYYNGTTYTSDSKWLIQRSTANRILLGGRNITTGTLGEFRGIVIGTAAPTVSSMGNGDIYLRYS